MSKIGITRRLMIATLAGFPTALASAQSRYPNRPIKVIIPLPPGSIADVLPRLIADRLASRWGQPVITENRPGAVHNLGAEAVARAQPDGYTLLAAPPPALVINQSLYAKLNFDPSAFVPVAIIASQANILVANAKTPFADLQQLIGYGKSNPEKLSYASPGNGSPQHLAMEQLKATAGIQLLHVPYRGLALAHTDLLAGHIDLMFDNLGSALPQIKSGQFKALGIGSDKRAAALPDVPAISELFRGFISTVWYSFVAPPHTPGEIVGKLSEAICDIIRQPDITARFQELSATPVGTSPAETAAFLTEERERWRKIITAAGIKPD